MTDTKYQEGLHKHIKVTTKLTHLWTICRAFNLSPDLSGSNGVPCKFAQATRLALAVGMWGHNGRDESVTDKHMKTIELGPPSESFFFQYFTKKIYLSRKFIKNILNTYTLKRYGWFALHHFPTPQYFLHPSKKLLPAVVISLRMEEKQSMYRLKS